MGLGKTLTMIALVAADQESGVDSGPHIEGPNNAGRRPGATLIIVPPPRRCPYNVSLNSSQLYTILILEAVQQHLFGPFLLT